MDIARRLTVNSVQVVVIGGGPAGAAAAISARQYGLNVTLIEQYAFPRHRPGESLHPGIEPLLLQLGLTSQWLKGFTRFSGHWQQVGNRRQFQAFGRDADGPWLGFHIPRATLDQQLLALAAGLGATIIQPCKAKAIRKNGDGYVISTATHGEYHADIVIDASGASHWLSRQLNHAVTPYSQPLIARYGYVAQPLNTGPLPAPCFMADRNRWLWTAPLDAEQQHWTQLIFNSSPADSAFIDKRYSVIDTAFAPRYRPDKNPPAELQHATPIGPIRGADVTWRKAEHCAGGSFFKVGDAGFVLDPASSHGVLKALMSGIYAAYVGSQTLARRLSPQQAQTCYQAWMDEHFMADKSALSDFYKGLTAF